MGLSIRYKILGTYVLVFALLGWLAVSSFVRVGKIKTRLLLIEEGYLPMLNVVSSLSRLYHLDDRFSLKEIAENTNNRLFIDTLRYSYPQLIRKGLKDIESRLKDRIIPLVKAGGEEGLRLPLAANISDAIRQAVIDHESFHDALVSSIKMVQSQGGAAGGNMADGFVVRRQALRDSLKVLNSRITVTLQKEIRSIGRMEIRGAWFTVALGGTGLLLVLGIAWIALVVLRPIRELTRGAEMIADGDYAHRVKINARDETGILAREFNRMAESIIQRTRDLVESARLAAIGEMSSQITHEIRNPLHSIGLNIELLKEDLAGDGVDDHRELLEKIEKEIKRLNGIAETYLYMARPGEQRKEAVSFSQVVDDVCFLLGSDARRRSVVIERLSEGDPQVFLADVNQMKQAVMNLLKNSLEAVEEGRGRITLREFREGASVCLEVTDNGPGIPKELHGRVFDTFFTTKKTGTGLGLAVTQKIIKDQGGSISVGAEAGAGARFVIVMPAGGD